jgi:geranylgeranyl pyrophosphate synthase
MSDDYTSACAGCGKNVGDDLAEGKPTLHLIYASNQAAKRPAQLIEAIVERNRPRTSGCQPTICMPPEP